MTKALVIGNGESRAWFKPCHQTIMDDNVMTWGCNAIYREGDHCVHNLVSMDYGMQQEIYDSGWWKENPEYGDVHNVYFSNWSPVPSEVADMMFMGTDIPESFVHRSKNRTGQCVISGKDPNTLHETIEYTMQMNPNLDMNDLKIKMGKDAGVWITYTNENDGIIDVGDPNLSTGNMALLLACHEQNAQEIYLLGFDLSVYDKPINNIYKGTDNYLPDSAKGFNPVNWIGQMSEIFDKYKSRTFYWVDCQVTGVANWHGSTVKDYHSNVRYLTKGELCDKLKIL